MSNTTTDNVLVNNENHSSTEHDHLTVKQELNSKNELTQRPMHSAFQSSDNIEQVSDRLEALKVNQDHSTSKTTMRCDAPPFSPASTNKSTSKTNFSFDLKKYKHDYFLSELTCSFDRDNAKFGAPTGICALPDDRLLVANFDRDSVFLTDIKGVVHQIFKDLPTPKAVIQNSSGSTNHAIVATRKEAVILDINTSKIVVRSKIRGFYPWNIQHIPEQDLYAACDPSGERIVFLDKNLAEVNVWSFHDSSQDHLLQSQPQLYQKIYPYAAYFLKNNVSFVLTHRQDKCHLHEYDNANPVPKATYQTPQSLQSYSIFVDDDKKCLIADKLNHRLVSIDANSVVDEYRSKTIQEPYSMTFLSDGTLCVTDWNKSHGSSGGISVISEQSLK